MICKVCIIGLGQIGGSLGKSLRDLVSKYYIIGIDLDKAILEKALKIGAADEVSLNLSAAKDCDIVVIATPVDLTASITKKLLPVLTKKTIITDVGSTKENVEEEIKKVLKKKNSPTFVFAHPMAGKEKNGIEAADATIFKNANVVITGSFKKDLKKESVIEKMWKAAGAHIIKMASKKHDEVTALTSHLPHLIAFSLNGLYKSELKKNKEISKIAAGSFESATRVANSSADMWAPIFEANKKNIKKELSLFIKELKKFEKSLSNKKAIKKEILRNQK